MIERLKVAAIPVRLPQELRGLDGLIIPGGESTAINKLMYDYNLTNEIGNLAKQGLPVFGTCAGMVLLAKKTPDNSVEPLGLMGITVKRNAFGRQLDSFETELPVPVLGGKPFPCVFIRAPVVEWIDDGVEVLARLGDSRCVAARQGKLLALAFHPELTSDLRFHQYFLDMVTGSR